MKKLKIEKFINDQIDESFTVPLAFINVLKILLPNSAINVLSNKGLEFEKIVEASKQNQPYQSSMDIVEKDVMKKVTITLI